MAMAFVKCMLTPWKVFGRYLRAWFASRTGGISQEKLPLYLGFFEFVHNVRRRGKALLPALLMVSLSSLKSILSD